MPTNFPNAIDSYISPSPSDSLNSPNVPHALLHENVHDAIEAIETKIGINNSSDVSSLDYKINRLINVFRTHRATTAAQGQALTRYYPINGCLLATETTESFVQTKMPRAGRILYLKTIISNTIGGTGQSFTCTVRKNGVDTALATVHASGETGIKESTTVVTFAAGDLISIVGVTSATTGNVNPVAHEVHVEFRS